MNKKEIESSIPLESGKPIERPVRFYRTLKVFNLKFKQAFKNTKAEGKLKDALIFAAVINLLLAIVAHIFSTYIYPDSIYTAAEIDRLFGKISPVFPLYKGLYIIAAPFIIAVLFSLKTAFYHIAVIPQKPKKGFKATLKTACYAESSKIYLIFYFIYLIIGRIPSAAEDYFYSFSVYLFIILWLVSFATSVAIITKGVMKFHGLEEPEATFVAFFPLIVIITIAIMISLL